MSNYQLMGIINRSRRCKMKLLINCNIYIYNVLHYYYNMIQSMDQRRSDGSGSYGLTGVGAVLNNYNIY